MKTFLLTLVAFTALMLYVLMALFAISAHAQTKQDQPDCSSSLDPRTPYSQVPLGCPQVKTPNNVAAKSVFDTKYLAPQPTLKQCQLDLAAWDQADDDWNTRQTARLAAEAAGKTPVDLKANPLPEDMLSVQELYRRSAEAQYCDLVFTAEIKRVRKLTPTSATVLDLLQEQNLMARQHLSLVREQLSRAESVIDKHLLWDEFVKESGN